MSVAHFTLATRDVAGTAAFYEATLGWRRVATPGNTPIEAMWLEIAPAAAGRAPQQVHVIGVADFEASAHEAEFGRHIAVFKRGGEFEAIKQRITEHGGELIEAIRPTPFERFFFRDPNGYIFEVIDEEHYAQEG